MRQTTTHTKGQFRVSNQPNMPVFDLWEEYPESTCKPHTQKGPEGILPEYSPTQLLLARRAGVGSHCEMGKNRRSEEGGRGRVEPFQNFKYEKVALFNMKRSQCLEMCYTSWATEWMKKKIKKSQNHQEHIQ